MLEKILKTYSTNKNVKFDDSQMTVSGIVVSTEHLDRDNEVVVQKGMRVDNFSGTYLLAHGLTQLRDNIPIGKVERVYSGDIDGVPATLADVQFFKPSIPDMEDPLPRLCYDMLKQGVMVGHSIGFLPQRVEELEITDEKRLNGRPPGKYRHYTDWELLEISLCSVPANPFAVSRVIAGELASGALTVKGLTSLWKNGIIPRMKGIVPFEETPMLPQDTSWDADEAVARIRKWASQDGSGEKDTIDWSKYRRAFLWVDPDADPENFGAYHLPHHDISDGRLVVNFRGCVACLVVLNGGRGGAPKGMSEDDIERAKSHIARHYEQFGVDFPEKDEDAGGSPEKTLWERIAVSFKEGNDGCR